MVRIDGIGRPNGIRPGVRTPPSRTAPFAVPTAAGDIRETGETASTQPVSLASILTLQELGGETPQDREALRHSHDMLEQLAALQRALLNGGDEGAALEKLAELAAVASHATDRRLAALVSAILVRVRVEMARRHA